MKVTATELEALQGIVDSYYHDGAEPLNNWVWSFSANPFKNSRTFAGALSSLIKKGLAKQDGEGREACVCITQAGLDALKGK